jgi:hypothetical protein
MKRLPLASILPALLALPLVACSSPATSEPYDPADAGADAPPDSPPDPPPDAPPDAPPGACVTAPSILLNEMNMYAAPVAAQVAAGSVFSAWSLGGGEGRAIYQSSLATGESSVMLEAAAFINLLHATDERVFIAVSQIFGENVLRLVRIDIYKMDSTLERSVDIPEALSDHTLRVLSGGVVLGGNGEVLREESGAFVPWITSDTFKFVPASVPTDENAWVASSDGRRACRIALPSAALADCIELPASINSWAIHSITRVDRLGDDTLVWALGDQGATFLRFLPGGQVEEILASKHQFSLNGFAVWNGAAYWLEQRSVSMNHYKTVVRSTESAGSTDIEGQSWFGGFHACEGGAGSEGFAAVKGSAIVRFPLP